MTIGFYGTLPTECNIVTHALPEQFVTTWQTWLIQSLSQSKSQLGTAWLDSYLTTPIWRFALSAGVCDDNAWVGILMPSVDCDGLYFPLTLAVNVDANYAITHSLTLADHWFEQLEAMALTVLEENISLPQFIDLLASLPKFSVKNQQYTVTNTQASIQVYHAEPVTEAFVELTADLLNTHLQHYSLWHRARTELEVAALLVYQNLPDKQEFVNFLSKPSEKKEDCTEPLDTWLSWAASDTGNRRSYNEDALLNKPEARLWAIADGMGGHKAGDVASQAIINALQYLPIHSTLALRINEIKQCLQRVNAELQAYAQREYHQQIVGSTVVILASEMPQAAVLWAGDSRLYRLRDNTLSQLTADHSMYKESSNSMVLTKAVGATEHITLDYKLFDVQANDLFLLCSDGLDKELDQAEIRHTMQSCLPKDIAKTLIDKTLERGARDNVSVVVVQYLAH